MLCVCGTPSPHLHMHCRIYFLVFFHSTHPYVYTAHILLTITNLFSLIILFISFVAFTALYRTPPCTQFRSTEQFCSFHVTVVDKFLGNTAKWSAVAWLDCRWEGMCTDSQCSCRLRFLASNFEFYNILSECSLCSRMLTLFLACIEYYCNCTNKYGLIYIKSNILLCKVSIEAPQLT